MVRIDGVQVTEDGRMKWGVVASLLVGAPVYAVQEGYIEAIHVFGDGLSKLASAPGSFFGEWLNLLFTGGARGISAGWWSFLDDATAFGGPLTFPLTVAAVVLTLFILSWGVRQIDV